MSGLTWPDARVSLPVSDETDGFIVADAVQGDADGDTFTPEDCHVWVHVDRAYVEDGHGGDDHTEEVSEQIAACLRGEHAAEVERLRAKLAERDERLRRIERNLVPGGGPVEHDYVEISPGEYQHAEKCDTCDTWRIARGEA